MFINCHHCHALVATNPATDEPPERCPRCGGRLRGEAVDDAAVSPAVAGEAAAAGDDAITGAAGPVSAAVDAAAEPRAPAGGDEGTTGAAPSIAAAPEPLPPPQPASGTDAPDPAGTAWRRAADMMAALAARVGPAGVSTPAPPADAAVASSTPHAAQDATAPPDDGQTSTMRAAPGPDASADMARTADDVLADAPTIAAAGADSPPSADMDAAPDAASGGVDARAPGTASAPAASAEIAPEAVDTSAGSALHGDVPPETAADVLPSAADASAHRQHDHTGDTEDAVAAVVAVAPASQPARTAPSFAARHAAPAAVPSRRRWPSPAIAAGLSTLLLLQILLADRDRLAADARWRPLLTSLCTAFGCSLPPWREPAAIRLVSRDVRAHPTRPGVLRATATLRNDARWAQAWPRVVLTLSDVDGRAIGMRDFAPHEYLGEAPTQDALSSGQSAMIRLDVLEPAANVVAFSFDFH